MSSLVVVALVLLLALCSIPVFAFGDEPAPEAVIPVPKLDPEAMTAARVRKEAELAAAEVKTEEELATPAAEAERESSEEAYTQIAASEAVDLLEESFAPTLEGLAEDPGRLLTEADVENVLSPTAARISTPTGGKEIVEGSTPLTSTLGGEGREPIDLGLEPSGEGFAPANPLTPTSLPGSAEEGIRLAGDVQVELPASADREAVRIGQSMLFYPETEEDTDTLVVPVIGGTEVFEQLRSAESPEEFRFDLNLPDGAVLEATEGGGAVVTDAGGKTLQTVPTPTSVDAQGATVPTAMSVEGDSLVVSVSLRESEVAYPVLVDPEFLNEPVNFFEWVPSEYTGGAEPYGLQQSGSALRAWSFGSNAYYAPGSWGQFGIASPGPTAFIAGASFWGLSFYPMCSNGQPHGYIGLWNPSYGVWNWLNTVSTYDYNDWWNTGWAGGPGTLWAVYGIGTAAASSQLPCVHEFWMGAYSLAEKDWTRPVITSVEGVPANRWINGQERGMTTVRSYDTGFGISRITVASQGAGNSTVTPNAACTGVSGHRCPSNAEVPWTTPGPWGAGKRKVLISVEDPMGNVEEYSPGYTYVDLNEPVVSFNGQFARATDEVGLPGQAAHNPAEENRLRLPTYKLKVNATDGNGAEDATMESGVASVEVKLDGVKQPFLVESEACSVAAVPNCAISGSSEVKLTALSAAAHELTVIATDAVGHKAERVIHFEYIPATGEGENEVLEHFPLSNGKGEEPGQPEVAVNIMNGNLVFHQKDGEVATTDAGGPIERVYNSQLPAAQSGEFGNGWTLANTPELEPGAGGAGAGKGILVQGDGTVETAVPLPVENGKQTFDPVTHASIEKVGSGYTVTDEGAEAEPPAELTSAGMVTALQGSGEASLELDHEGGKLAELSVDDPRTAAGAAEQAVTENGLGFLLSAGAAGTLSHPMDVATDTAGDVYVADAGNHKVQEFGPGGAFIRQWGTTGTGQGQFGEIVGIAIGGGNVYVAEPTRIQEFTAAGAFIRQIGGEGAANGKFLKLAAIAVDGSGNLFALDMPSTAYRVQKLTSTGTYVSNFAVTKGAGSTQLSEPRGLNFDNEGHLWIVDTGNSRLREVTATGTAMQNVGTLGADPGELSHPRGVTVDGAGHLWVADTGNSRVQELTPTGAYLARFGEPGTGVGGLSEPSDVALDASGNLWVASTGNNRVERWTPSEPQAPAPVTAAPSAAVATSGGLISSIKGGAIGPIAYSHEGTFLTAVAGPEGTSKYGKDSAGRLNKVELPNKSEVEVVYDSVGRVTQLKVSLEGGAVKTTTFQYLVETATAARETIVRRPAISATHYAIDEFANVVKWWNALEPPKLQELDGTLYTERTEVVATAAVGDKELRVEARSPEGIASIQIVANGNQIVAEKVCEAAHAFECTSLSKIFVTETGNWPPGLVSFEVIATEANELGSSSTHFSINMPYTPPPTGSKLEQPTFERVLHFREEFGLDLDLKGNERALVERINKLIAAWDSPNSPEGQVARASSERWGVPLRAADVAELEYREWFYNVNAERIDRWAEETSPSNYGGYYLDQRAGGIMHIGFLSNQAEALASLESLLSLVAKERLQSYPTAPTASYFSVQATAERVDNTVAANPTLAGLVVGVETDESGRTVHVGATNVSTVQTILVEALGSNAPITVEPEARSGSFLSGRFRNEGRMRAGDAIFTKHFNAEKQHDGNSLCTAGFGAKDKKGEVAGKAIWRVFLLTAGHCNGPQQPQTVYRSTDSNPLNESNWKEVGTVTRTGFRVTGSPVDTDAEAIRVEDGDVVPQGIFGAGGNLQPIEPATTVRKHQTVCFSGARTQGVSCGQVTGRALNWRGAPDGVPRSGYWVKFEPKALEGDSGSPVYSIFGGSVGLISADRNGGTETYVVPLITPPGLNPGTVPGVLHDPNLAPLSLKLAADN